MPVSFARWRGIVAFGSVLAVSGCAVLKSKPPEQIVKARAQARGDALVKGKVEAAYGYLSPGSKAVRTVDGYRNEIKVGFWAAATVEQVQCGSEDSCEAQVSIEYKARGLRVKTPLTETWIRQQGNWWYVLK